MFNLEQSIDEWRRQMLARGITVIVLEELESHLREEIGRQMRAEANAPVAFHIAAAQIGQAQTIKTEFTKIERNGMKLTLILLGIFGVLFGMAMVLPQMAWYRDHQTLPANHLGPLLLGLFIVASGLGTGVYVLKKRKA